MGYTQPFFKLDGLEMPSNAGMRIAFTDEAIWLELVSSAGLVLSRRQVTEDKFCSMIDTATAFFDELFATDSELPPQYPQHARMMRNPGWWARWPALPLVNRRGGKFGVIYAGNPTVVHVVNVNLQDQPHEVMSYDSVEAVVLDGWEVD